MSIFTPCSQGVKLLPLLVSVCLLQSGCDHTERQPIAGQAVEVTAVTVAPVNVPLNPSFVARVRSSHDVEIIARVSGFLESIAYTEGQKVNPGDILFRIDRKPFEAQRNSAQAQVKNLEAELWTAKAQLDRIRPLAEKKAASQSDLDNAKGRFMAAEAAVVEAKARLQKAELELDYTIIRSPIAGVAGRSLVREGIYLSASSTEARLTHVVQLDPIWVEFSVTQNQFTRMQDDIASGRVVSPSTSEYTIEVEFADGRKYPHTGRFTYADRTLDPRTGTFMVRVEIPNPDEVLLPGMFVHARVKGAFRPQAVLVPQKAVQQTANGHIVYLVNEKGAAEIRPVVMGRWVGSDWIVDQGLHPGERVIMEGFQRLAPGTPVRVSEPETSIKPAAAGDR